MILLFYLKLVVSGTVARNLFVIKVFTFYFFELEVRVASY